MKKIFILSCLFIVIAISISLMLYTWFQNEQNLPAPCETIIIHNKKKENYKKRKEWIEQMHKSAPGVNWKAMDQKTRSLKAKERSKINTKKKDSRDTPRRVSTNGNITGTWREAGSNNLSGRMHVSETDTTDGFIYCGSAGGNIWKGNLDGTSWVSLNDNLKIPDINSAKYFIK